MAATFKRRVEPHFHYSQCRLQAHHPLTKGEHIGVIMFPRQLCRIEIPAQSATNTRNTIGSDALAVARPPQHNPSLTFSSSHSLSDRTNKKRIVDGLGRV